MRACALASRWRSARRWRSAHAWHRTPRFSDRLCYPTPDEIRRLLSIFFRIPLSAQPWVPDSLQNSYRGIDMFPVLRECCHATRTRACHAIMLSLVGDAAFGTLYCALLAWFIVLSHRSLSRFRAYVPPTSHFGHWQYPATAGEYARPLGLFSLPTLGPIAFHATGFLLVASLVLQASGTWLHVTAPMSALLLVLYFSAVRMHGYVRNQADIAPVILFIIAAAPPGEACSHAKLMLSLAYCSSGLCKIRLTGALRWSRGSNLRRLVRRSSIAHNFGSIQTSNPQGLLRRMLPQQPLRVCAPRLRSSFAAGGQVCP